MLSRRLFIAAGLLGTVGLPALAQFTGPSVSGQTVSVAEALSSRTGRYVTVEGSIVAHQREDYYTFRDGTGDIRVEIPSATFGGRQVGPNNRVRILGEVDSGRSGPYIWVKSLQIL